jgi:hypothetical protein
MYCRHASEMRSAALLTQGQAPSAGEPHKLALKSTVGLIPTPATNLGHYVAKDAPQSVKLMPDGWPGAVPG